MSILSICIPTYNRAHLLDLCISSFINDAIKYNINIYISDNNSKDNTSEVIDKYKKIYKNIFYKRQKVTVSIDHNMLDVLKMANTEYALWLGDDDLLKPDAVYNILKYLNQKPDLLVIKLSQTQNIKNRYTDPFSFFYDYGMIGMGYSMHFSSLVVKVKDILCNKNIDRFFGTYHLYAGAVFDYLLYKYERENKILVLFTNDIYVTLGTVCKSWEDNAIAIFWIFIPKYIDLFNKKYKDNTLFKQKIAIFYKDVLSEVPLSKISILQKILANIMKSKLNVKYKVKILKIKQKLGFIIAKIRNK